MSEASNRAARAAARSAQDAANRAKQSDAQREPDLRKLYQRKHAPFSPGAQAFRLTLLRPEFSKRKRRLDIDGMVESLEWRYEPGNPVLMGTVTMKQPDMGKSAKEDVRDGHVLQCQVQYGGKWREVWRMRLYDGQKTLQGTLTWELSDLGRMLQESTDKWHFTKSKKKGKPKGWKCHEVLRDVADRYKIPLGKIAAGKHFITDLSGEMSPMQVIQKAYAIEKNATGKRFVIQWRNGRLNVLPQRRNPLLYVLADSIEDAALSRNERDEKFATAVTVRATVKQKGTKKKKKIEVLYKNKAAVKRDGYIHRDIKGGDVKDRADAMRKAKRYIKDHSERKFTLEQISHRGIAFIRRGDMIQVPLGKEYKELKGKDSICFVSAGNWSLGGGEFTMTLDVTFDDAIGDGKKEDKEKEERAAKREAKEAAKEAA